MNSNNVTLTKVTWKTEVVRVIRRDGIVAALVKGFPADLVWSDGNPTPYESLIIETNDHKFYLLESDNFGKSLKRLEDSQDSLMDLLVDDDWFLQLPLSKGKKFCEPEGLQRPDGRYCWVVGAPRAVDLGHIKGIRPEKRKQFVIEYLTAPDDTEFRFVSGVGITRFGFHHHGTVADTEIRLVEFHAGKDSQN